MDEQYICAKLPGSQAYHLDQPVLLGHDGRQSDYHGPSQSTLLTLGVDPGTNRCALEARIRKAL